MTAAGSRGLPRRDRAGYGEAMRVGEAKAAAIQWVRRHAAERADFQGAFFTGSTAGLPPDAPLPPASDVDVALILAGTRAPLKPGKFVYEGVLIEATYLAAADFAVAERVAASYHLAHAFSRDTIISDPTGRLRSLHEAIAPAFADPAAIQRRYEDAISRIETRLAALNTAAPWHEQVLAWMFPTGVTTHVVLVAALQNPTVRLRYLAARGVLQRHGRLDLYPRLLELLGCESVTPDRVQHHLDTLAAAFDAAAAVARTPFFFSSDITPAARRIAIDGSRALIDAGDHREAVFWIIATHARCQAILAADAPIELQRELRPAFDAAVGDLLDLRSSDDLVRRAAAVRGFIPTLRSAAAAIAGK